MLPDFLIIGAQKAGSTSVYNQLRQHPQVFLPDKKEIGYFSRKFHYGLDYYQEYFAPAKEGQIKGEATPDYLHFPNMAERIHETLPNVKIIAILREPIARAYSAFCMQLRKGAEPRDTTFLDAVNKSPEYLDFGRYANLLTPYYERFDKSQILICWFETFKDQPQEFYDTLCDFLGIDRLEDIVKTSKASNKKEGRMPSDTMSYRILFWLRQVYGSMANSSIGRLIANPWMRKHLIKIRRFLMRRMKKGDSYPPFTDEDRKRLLPTIIEDNQRLAQLTGRDLSNWNQL